MGRALVCAVRHTARPAGGRLEERAVLCDAIARLPDLLDIVRASKRVVPGGEQLADGGEQLRAPLLGELGPEGVDGDIDSTAVGFEGEDALHDVRGWSAERSAEGVEVLEVRFVKRVADDLDVEVVKVRSAQAVTEIRG